MKRLLPVLALVLLSTAPALADPIKVVELGLQYAAGSNPVVNWNIQAYPLRNPVPPHQNSSDFYGVGTTAVANVICQSSCGLGDGLKINLTVSGLQLSNIQYNGTFYPIIYFSGILNVNSIAFQKLNSIPFWRREVHISGSLTGCLDPQCATVVFPLNINLFGTMRDVSFTRDSSGHLVLASASFQAPEPSTLALLVTGLAAMAIRRPRKLLDGL